MMPTVSPRLILMFTPCRIFLFPKDLWTSLSSMRTSLSFSVLPAGNINGRALYLGRWMVSISCKAVVTCHRTTGCISGKTAYEQAAVLVRHSSGCCLDHDTYCVFHKIADFFRRVSSCEYGTWLRLPAHLPCNQQLCLRSEGSLPSRASSMNGNSLPE